MVEVRLHGPLAAQFGMVWNLDVGSPREAVAAIAAMKSGFRSAIMELSRKGMVFRVRSKNHDYCDDDIDLRLGSTRRLDIIPIVAGASAGIRFVIGATLVVVGVLNIASPWGVAALSTGASLMLGAVTEWLTPTPKRSDVTNAQSWQISGPTNNIDQGLPVPIIYGEVLTGSQPISAGISVSQATVDGSVDPMVTIGGNLDPVLLFRNAGPYTVVVILSASPFNLNEPFTYQWQVTGFAGAVAKRLSKVNEASMRLEIDYNLAELQTLDDPGQVTVTVTGTYKQEQKTINKVETVTIHLDGKQIPYNDGAQGGL